MAAALRYARPSLATIPDARLIAEVRKATGVPTGDTELPALVDALSSFDVPSAPLFAADGGGNDPLAAFRLVLARGRPIIATVGGAALGRGVNYGDHFVLITGMDPRTQELDVLDPDTQAARTAAWLPGGRQVWPAALVRAALGAARERDALAIVIGARREGAIAPRTIFLLVAAGLALLALCGWRRRDPSDSTREQLERQPERAEVRAWREMRLPYYQPRQRIWQSGSAAWRA